MVISHCALHRKDSLCVLARGFCLNRRVGQGELHIVAARLGCERVLTKLSDKELIKIHDRINFDFYARLSHIFVVQNRSLYLFTAHRIS